MVRVQRTWLQLLLLFAIVFIAGCASVPGARAPNEAETTHWQGRLALKVYSTPVQAMTANFELQGNAQSGTLVLTTVLGSTLARMQWDATSATLQSSNGVQQFESLAALVRHATGTDLPVASLFAWLRGQPATATDWEADLSEIPNGRLNARRMTAINAAELKIILDQ
jgi:outer membrane lipoprotein LolB